MPSIFIHLCLKSSYLQVHLKCCEIFMLITWLITLILGVESSRIWGLQTAYKKVRKYQLFHRHLQLFKKLFYIFFLLKKIIVKKLWPHFHGHKDVFKTNYKSQQVCVYTWLMFKVVFFFFWLVNKNLSVLTSVISKKSRIWNNWNWTKHEQEDWKWVSVTTLHNKWNVCFLDFYTCILKDLW